MNVTSNKQVREAITAAPYKSMYTGPEVEQAITEARQIPEYIAANVMIPHINFTGDNLLQQFTTVTQTAWIEAVVLVVLTPFSASTPKYSYEISADGLTLASISPEMLMTPNLTTTLYIHQVVNPGTTISMVGSSTNAFGDVQAKLLIR